MLPSSDAQLKLEKIRLLEQKNELREGLPHLYGWKWYKWAREFFESTNKMCMLTAANQVSKSSTQIRKCIDWATNKEKWPLLWRTRPLVFWYLYPAKDVATIEFQKKWIPEFMPRGKYKNDPVYGWEAVYEGKHIHHIDFNSGVSVYFKTYAQDVINLQTGTCHAIMCDEEIPVDYYDELAQRISATDGYFSMVFTATLGQDLWYKAIERRGFDDEMFKDADKWQISKYDCLFYDDGTKSHWTEEKIRREERQCKNQNEVLKRIYGRFVQDTGLTYPGYSREANRQSGGAIPGDWLHYAGVEVGSGGEHGHPAAIVFVACSPDMRRGRVYRAWRGDGISTTASDVLMKYIELRGHQTIQRQFYDWASKDFFTIAARIGEPFEMAEKSHEIGEQSLNALFKNGMLTLDANDHEIDKLEIELLTLNKTLDKRKAKDDLVDAMRYAVSKLPWDWSAITGAEVAKAKEYTGPSGGIDLLYRDGKIKKEDAIPNYVEPTELDYEFDEVNSLYG